MTGDNIPFRKLGFCNIDDILAAAKDYCRVVYDRAGKTMVQAVTDESQVHLVQVTFIIFVYPDPNKSSVKCLPLSFSLVWKMF